MALVEGLTHEYTSTVLDACGRILAEAISGQYIFAAGQTDVVTNLEDTIVPLADDFSEQQMPVVTLSLGPWSPLLQPGNERLTLTLQGTVWRDRVPLGENVVSLYSDRDAIADAVIAHSKAFLVAVEIQSVVLMGGPGIRARSVPRGDAASGLGTRLFLTLPFTLEVKANRAISAKAA